MSQTMSNEIQNIHYCTILSAGQWDFLLEGRFSPLRQKCLYRLMKGAVRTRTAYKIKALILCWRWDRWRLPMWSWLSF